MYCQFVSVVGQGPMQPEGCRQVNWWRQHAATSGLVNCQVYTTTTTLN